MRAITYVFFTSLWAWPLAVVGAEPRAAKTIVLDEQAVQNLGLETVLVEQTDFEESFFAIGRIEEIPSKHAVLSSRIAGRVVGLSAFEGEWVERNQELCRVESRQPGNPPPVIALKSPGTGLVVESHVRIGEPVEPDDELLDILDLRSVWAVVHVPEELASRLTPGKTRAHLRVPALGKQTVDATLLRFGTAADREAGTIDAIFPVSNADLRMRPGMRVEASVVTGVRPGVMAVPRSAIQGGPLDRVVYVKDFDLPNAFVRSPVVVGSQNDRYVEIVSGLFADVDEVVTTGSYLLGFSGDSTVSLKEALDAAHGHAHAEDGSELTPEQLAASAAEEAAHGAGHGPPGTLTYFLGIACALQFALLILAMVWRRRGDATPATEA